MYLDIIEVGYGSRLSKDKDAKNCIAIAILTTGMWWWKKKETVFAVLVPTSWESNSIDCDTWYGYANIGYFHIRKEAEEYLKQLNGEE